jgi:hypothetical protein
VKLHEIPIEAADIEAELAENYGELTPEIEHRIAAFLHDGKDKIEAGAVVVKSLEADAAICKQEAQRLMQRAQGLEKGADRLKGLVLYAVDEGFGGKVRTQKYTVWGQNAAAAVSFEIKPGSNIYELASESPWSIRTQDPEIDRLALKEAQKAGVEMPDCIVVTEHVGTRYLRIR